MTKVDAKATIVLILSFCLVQRFLTEYRTSVVQWNNLKSKSCLSSASMSNHRRATGPKFVFVVGLESTGHHLFKELYRKSPNMARLHRSGVYRLLTELAWFMYEVGGLMTLHCLETKAAPAIHTFSPVRVCPTADSGCLHREIVHRLRNISNAFGPDDITIPVNSIGAVDSMASYPNFQHPCRSLEYPSLDLFYQACEDAGVQCGHLLLYRDPYEVMKATTLTIPHNPGIAHAMQLYTTMLSAMFVQFTAHPTKTYGCTGFHETNQTWDEKWNTIGELLGFKDQTYFRRLIEATYVPRTPIPQHNRTAIVPEKYQVLMDSFSRTHDAVVNLCQSNLLGTHKIMSHDPVLSSSRNNSIE